MPPSTEFAPLPALLGGVLIGISAVVLLLASGRVAGISGMVRRLLPPYEGSAPLESAVFLSGLVAAPLTWTAATGAPVLQSVPSSSSLLIVAGLLVGFGAVYGGGCTSGHGVCGLSRFSKRSIAATLTFMATAALTVYAVRHVLGGWPWV